MEAKECYTYRARAAWAATQVVVDLVLHMWGGRAASSVGLRLQEGRMNNSNAAHLPALDSSTQLLEAFST